ncbi:MAG: peptide chain release factor N(5)-glutamine methyltransferase [Patescibacteria group bacterium]|nr:peptide chain release factor N(5)-glutamine methyltransferase [Patescibacteria group bacterium]
MTIKDTLKKSALELNNISESSDLDAEVLLSFVLRKNKEYLFANPEIELKQEQLEQFEKLLARRKKHEPIAYIINNKEFFGIDFFVDKRVLIPRPETEILVEEVLKIVKNTNCQYVLVDVGTGSGCIAVSLAKNLTNAKIFAIDISKDALDVAKINVEKNNANIQLLSGNLLEPLGNNKVDIICANLPYITVEQLNLTEEDVRKFEPKSALIAKEETTLYSNLLDQAPKFLNKNGIIFFEIDPVFKDKIIKLVKEKMPNAKYEIKNDLAGLERVMIIKT